MSYTDSCCYSIRLLAKLKALNNKALLDFNLINKAIYWAKKYHGKQLRKSGEPFYSHPLEVAYLVSDYKLTTEVIIASILHDIVEDTEVTTGMILNNFNWRIAEMVDRLTRDKADGTRLTVEDIINNAYQFQDKEVLLIKLMDRFHNANTVSAISSNKIEKLVFDTLDHFIILSTYLELFEHEQELVNLCISLHKVKANCKPIYFSAVKGTYHFLALDFQNEINQIYNL